MGHYGLLILNRPHLECVLRVFIDHYNGYRPHRALQLTAPAPLRATDPLATKRRGVRVQRRDRLGGLLHEYSVAA
jgi:putative transposase